MPGLLDDMPASLFEYWAAFDAYEPFGQRREDLRWAVLCSTLANVFRDKKSRRVKAEEFLRVLRPVRPEPMTGKQLGAALRTWASQMKAAGNRGLRPKPRQVDPATRPPRRRPPPERKRP